MRAAAAELAADLERVDATTFSAALDQEILARGTAFIDGVRRYRSHPYRRTLVDPPAAWREGSTRLLVFDPPGGAGAGGRPLLLVPSLVNRGYVLDLMERRSLARDLAARGFRPALLDWGAPGEEERAFTVADYVARATRAFDRLDAGGTGPRPVVLGYCMGGLLTLALARRRIRRLAGLVLLATPWDFHAGGTPELFRGVAGQAAWLADAGGALPVDALQALFAALDPYQIQRKFRAFAALDPRSAAARTFVALEDWLNDGVPLAAPVARECLQAWYVDNAPARGAWHVDGTPVDPAGLDLPALVCVPRRDVIVPPETAAPLARALPRATLRTVLAGHVGMVAGRSARRSLYAPLARWLARLTG